MAEDPASDFTAGELRRFGALARRSLILSSDGDAARHSGSLRPLHVYNAGFLRQRGLRELLAAAGWRVHVGAPPLGRDTSVGVWGRKPVSVRGRSIAKTFNRPLITIEDGFLRSIYPGDRTVPPLSLIIDDVGVYYDASAPSRLEVCLQNREPGHDDIDRARAGIAELRDLQVSKYTPPTSVQPPEPGYVLVIDQTVGDASIPGAMANAKAFQRMLEAARIENPGARIVIKSHPDVIAGKKRGHFSAEDAEQNAVFWGHATNPWALIEGADCIYTVSSQMGYEAVLASKPVRCFGAAFYSGWGLTEDEIPIRRRTARHSAETLFAACHLACPIYFDPWRQRLCTFEEAVDVLSTLLMHERQAPDTKGEVFGGVRLWKRRNLTRFRSRLKHPPKFADDAVSAKEVARREQRRLWLWAGHAKPDDPPNTGYVEDGFLRSVGLGAELTQAASLVFDRRGIYYDPSKPSDLELHVATATEGQADEARAERLIQTIVSARLSKYNIGSPDVAFSTDKKVVLVPGQVEDDASIQRGTGDVRTNLRLLQMARQANPDAFLIYKPHPDVEAGLRVGAIPLDQARGMADHVAHSASPAALLDQADAVWTMTSLMGFEALIRGKSVTCLGMPFYAGWGLTRDLGPQCPRRAARPTLPQLVWAALIAYPSYLDPVSGLPCPPEIIIERLASGQAFPKATALSKLQALFANQTWLWR